ncbi:hypothetical protein [Parendozoicomonas haliclonae]|uniref:Uncharacterized protein n=1 Tax=Parendozoicomonas haliclonae TaxID=1960125 RepID=A0A1X7AH51_9GAMM|nr:hypothetical protein [Parendozoicomonas haliclonae]SMA41710.1 hypothetical protein EHSB41UT_01310 [Parendozoicomonas haliclonae]
MANRGSYPHPVVDAADDVSSDFKVINILVDSSQQDIEITYEIRTDDPDLRRLLDNGSAIHSLRWRCSSTISTGEMEPAEYQRTSTGFRLRAWLDQQQVKGRVDANVRIIVAKELRNHCWLRQHNDYGDASFDLLPGDVLADGGPFSFDAEKIYDPLNPPVGSCFKFIRSTRHKGIKAAFDGNETVDVQIPEKTFDNFQLFSHRPDLQISLVVLPALMETLNFIKSNKESEEEPLDDKIWYREIDQLVEARGGWKQSVLELAQKVLENPIDTAIRAGLVSEEED